MDSPASINYSIDSPPVNSRAKLNLEHLIHGVERSQQQCYRLIVGGPDEMFMQNIDGWQLGWLYGKIKPQITNVPHFLFENRFFRVS